MKLTRLNKALPMSRALRRQMAGLNRQRMARWSKAVPRTLDRKIAKRRRQQVDRLGRPKGPIWSQALAWQIARGIGAGGNVRAVARRLGIPNQTIYRHRQTDPYFAALWERELDKRYLALEDALLERMTNGWEEEVFYQGKNVGKRRVYDHNNGLKLLDMKLREERADRAEVRAAEIAAERLAEEKAARMAAVGAEVAAQEKAQSALTDKDYLLAEMMMRHRNRHPEEWDGDLHVSSGINLADCPAYHALD